MTITLCKASLTDCCELYDLQVKSFRVLLEKYQDYNSNPGAETIEKTRNRLKESFTDYYFIRQSDSNIGALRIVRFEGNCKLKQICILPEYQGNGYAQQAIVLAESKYPDAIRWELDTVKQEEKLCYLYEKMGYRRTGKEQNIKDGMDIVFYEKNMEEQKKTYDVSESKEVWSSDFFLFFKYKNRLADSDMLAYNNIDKHQCEVENGIC